MTQSADWDDFLKATEAEVTPSVFNIEPDESVEDPEAHVTNVPFHKTAAALWMMVTGGGIALVLTIYALASYVSGQKQVVAAAPVSGVDPFAEKSTGGFLPKTEENPGMPVAPAPAPTKTVVVRKTPARVAPVIQDRPRRSYAAPEVTYPSRRTFEPRTEPVVRSTPQPVAMHPVAAPVKLEKPDPLPDAIGALYAPATEEGPQVDTATSIVAMAPSKGKNSSVDEALAIYDGTVPKIKEVAFTSPVPQYSANAEPEYAVPPTPFPKDGGSPLTSEEYSRKYPQEVERESQQRILSRLAMVPQGSQIKGQTMGMLSWDSSESFPVGEEIRIKVRAPYRQNGEIVIPEGSVAIAQSDKGTMGEFIMANVTRIETPDGKSYTIDPGMLTASNSDGYLQGKLKEPKSGGGAGAVFSRLGRSIAAIGVASVLPKGDDFGSRVAQNAAAEALDGVDRMAEPRVDRNRRGATPSFYYLKPKTSVALIANGDIQLTEVGQ